MKIEQDGYYLNAQGEILKIELLINGVPADESGNLYNLSGRHIESEPGKYDLIGYIPPELHYHILKIINNYHTCEPVKTFINKLYKDENVKK